MEPAAQGLGRQFPLRAVHGHGSNPNVVYSSPTHCANAMTGLPTQPSVTPAQDSERDALRQRLDRLDGYLQTDPGNPALRIDLFETALRCGEWGRAEAQLRHGITLASDSLSWALREGDFWLAQKAYAQARQVLQRLQTITDKPPGFADVVLHNIAYIDFCERQFATCIERLAPRLEPTHYPTATEQSSDASIPPFLDSAIEPALQQLWLRALHHANELDRAMAWTSWADQTQRLDARAAGVASLIALDNSSIDLAQRWSTAALASPQTQDRPIEAFVTQASLALANQDAQRALQLADLATQINPADGRAWSARAFADLLAGDLPAAQTHFQQALQTMPGHIGTWHGLAWTQLVAQDLAAAQTSFEHALSMDRNFAENHGGLAVVLAMRNQEVAAREHIELAMRLDRSNLSGQYAQALLSGQANNAADVQRLAKRMLQSGAGPLSSFAEWIPPDSDVK
jgi:Tfp pilus assembly protein PilF